MRRLFLICALTLCWLVLGAASGFADPILWTLTNVTFDDGGTASGSFTYDATTNVYSGINITTTLGSTFAGAAYTAPFPGNFSQATGFFALPNALPVTGTPVLGLAFPNGLSNSGGTVHLEGSEYTCFNSVCDALTFKRGLSGSVVGAPFAAAVPEPSSLLLMASGVGILGLGKRVRNCRKV